MVNLGVYSEAVCITSRWRIKFGPIDAIAIAEFTVVHAVSSYVFFASIPCKQLSS
jgi:hypothetical protein